MRALAIGLVALVGGCASLPDDGVLACAPDVAHPCPDGFDCIEGHCFRHGHGPPPDMSVGAMGDMATVAPHAHITVSAATIDLLAFGTPAQQAQVSATVTDLHSGEISTVTFSVDSGASAVITSGAIGGTAATLQPATLTSPVVTAAPAPTVIRATSDADPSATTTITVNVHAWVDDSDGPRQALGAGYVSKLWAVDVAKNGNAMVGGWTANPALPSPAGTPYVTAAIKISGNWTAALNQNGGQGGGLVSSVSAVNDGTFLVAGVASNQSLDADQTKPLFVYHCAATCPTNANLLPTTTGNCGTNEMTNAFPTTVCPHVVALGTSKFVTFTRDYYMTGFACNPRAPESKVIYDTSGSIDATFSTSNLLAFGNDQVTVKGNSCPFASYVSMTNTPYNAITGLAVNSDQVWISGYAPCGTYAAAGDGCDGAADSTNTFNGLAAITGTAGTTLWRTYHGQAVTGDINEGIIKRGYDDSLLAIRGAPSTGGPSSLMWFPSGDPPVGAQYVRPTLPAGASDTGMAIGGAGTGGSAWSPSQPDVFYAFSRVQANVTTYYFAWQPGTDPAKAQIVSVGTGSTGFVILDTAFNRTAARVEGYAVGQRLDTGAPFVAHLQ